MKYKIIFVCVLITFFVQLFADDVKYFEKLSENEIITCSHNGSNSSNVTLYAEDIMSGQKREIGYWKDVPTGYALRYGDNNKTGFMLFFTGIVKNNNDGSLSRVYKVQLVDGEKGTIENITEVNIPYKVSADAKYILNVESESDNQTAYLKLTEVKTKESIYFSWKIKEPLSPGGFDVRRNDTDGFRILGTNEGGYVSAIANLEPNTKQLIVELDLDNTAKLADFFHTSDDQFYDEDIWPCMQ